jgi:hypothetical protein
MSASAAATVQADIQALAYCVRWSWCAGTSVDWASQRTAMPLLLCQSCVAQLDSMSCCSVLLSNAAVQCCCSVLLPVLLPSAAPLTQQAHVLLSCTPGL